MAFNFLKKLTSDKEEKAAESHTGSAKYLQLKVREVIQETQDAISIVFDDPDQKIKYKPGQFFTLIPTIEGKKVRRAYSVCSSPYTDPFPRVSVKRVEGGLVSNYLNDKLKAGDTLEVMEPMGNFTVEPEEGKKRHLILFGGGSGITPLMSIAKSVLHVEPESQVSLIYANRNESSIIFRVELNELQKTYGKRFKLIHVLDQKPLDWECPTGLLNPDLLKQLLKQLPEWPLEQSQYYMCGPEGMMVNVEETLKDLNIPKEQVHRESFVSGRNEPASAEADPVTASGDDVLQSREVTIILDGEKYQLTVEPDKTILEAALEQDIDMPYSCQGGFCTACRGKCLSGKVSMEESEGLSEEELEEGYVLNCVGHPLTGDVVIEIG